MFNWLKNLFKKKKSNTSETPTSSNIPNSNIKKIALLVGHGAGDPGATCWNKMAEHDYNSLVASILEQSDIADRIKVFYKTKRTGWVATYAQVALFNPDVSIELHLNAANGTAVGCEVLCLAIDKQSSIIGKQYAEQFNKTFNRKLRGEKGIKWISSGDRGHGNLVGAKAVAKHSILVEPFFCDNKEEWIEPNTYAEFLTKFIKSLV
jgi:N-acetylmuramoyl-L-alanine amidase